MIDFAKIEQYRKNNRIEAKKVIGGCPKAYGKPTTPLPTHGGIILLAVEEVPDKSHCTIDLLDLDRLIKEFWDIVNAPVKTSVNILFAKDVFVQEVEADHIIVINSLCTERSDKPVYVDGNLLCLTSVTVKVTIAAPERSTKLWCTMLP